MNPTTPARVPQTPTQTRTTSVMIEIPAGDAGIAKMRNGHPLRHAIPANTRVTYSSTDAYVWVCCAMIRTRSGEIEQGSHEFMMSRAKAIEYLGMGATEKPTLTGPSANSKIDDWEEAERKGRLTEKRKKFAQKFRPPDTSTKGKVSLGDRTLRYLNWQTPRADIVLEDDEHALDMHLKVDVEKDIYLKFETNDGIKKEVPLGSVYVMILSSRMYPFQPLPYFALPDSQVDYILRFAVDRYDWQTDMKPFATIKYNCNTGETSLENGGVWNDMFMGKVVPVFAEHVKTISDALKSFTWAAEELRDVEMGVSRDDDNHVILSAKFPDVNNLGSFIAKFHESDQLIQARFVEVSERIPTPIREELIYVPLSIRLQLRSGEISGQQALELINRGEYHTTLP